jgi:hypothetical protein
MSRRPGYYVQYKDKAGNIQKAIAYKDEQSPEFVKVKKVFIRLIDDRFQFKTDEKGKKIVALKAETDLKIIGFTD